MQSILSIMILVSVVTSAHATPVSQFEVCFKERAAQIPAEADKVFLESYLTYLKSGKPADGEIVISKMQELAKSQGGKFSIDWVSLFEGRRELCCGGPETCSESFGSVSLKALWPRVEKGWVTAISVVLMY